MERMIEVPPRVSPANDNGYLEELTKAIFRSGFSWRVVRQKWPNFQKGFDGFEVERVAAYGFEDLTRLFNDGGIIRNQRKILWTVDNARTILELAEEYGSFRSYLRSMDHLDYYQRMKVLTGQFRGWAAPGSSYSCTASTSLPPTGTIDSRELTDTGASVRVLAYRWR